MCLSTSGNYIQVEILTGRNSYLIVNEFFSTVSGKNFDLCIISTRNKTHYPLEKFSTSSEVPQNHNDLPSYVYFCTVNSVLYRVCICTMYGVHCICTRVYSTTYVRVRRVYDKSYRVNSPI